MDGYTPTIELAFRIKNLLEQIPQEYQARACRECYGMDDFEFERKLTAYVLHKTWETYDHPVDEAEAVNFRDAWCDERIDTGLIELNATYRPAVMDTDDLPF